ncbi:MAG: HIRAN domain-containing protein [Phascolarctobacterium sp.]|nr:HIRAN domain-containing protein [Phascolarctobacterium sp.]
MKNVFVTITGINHYFGTAPFKKGIVVECKKEPENQYDPEAIKVLSEGYGKVGYIANSVNTRKGETLSAGAVGSLTKKKFKVKVIGVTDFFAIAKVVKGLK